ncbi:MAG TPA: hypothetical protein VFF27_02105 [Bacteroidia bacterium]|nr:hypothetical protein [Bacteroidia bacterium]
MVLIKIRGIQLKKEAQEIGAGVLLFLGILWVLIYGAYYGYQHLPFPACLTAGLFFICLSIQLSRKDKSFVYNCIENPKREIYMEYSILTAPFSLPALLTPSWFLCPLLLISLAIIPLFKYTVKQKTYFKKISRFISPKAFEFISIFRKSFLFFIPLYILALAFSWFRILPLVLLWLFVTSVASSFMECEPLNILREHDASPASFLKQKIILNTKYIFVLLLPIVLINTLFNPEFWLFNLLFIPAQLALLSLAICLKYSNYEPNKLFIGNNLMLSFVALAVIVPYFLPIPLLMTIASYKKATNHLNTYLHD